MKHRFCSAIKKGHFKGRFGFGVVLVSVLFAGQAMAFNVDLFGEPLSVQGYINQSVQFGVRADTYDTMHGFQQALMQALLELDYRPTDDLRLFVTGQLTKDWAYNILENNHDWEFRQFDKSRHYMSLRTDYEDVLKECHVTWKPGNASIKVGKQIVVWGQMDGFRIMDQINPRDTRLGPSDVEFETSIIPIWLVRAEYFPPTLPSLLKDLGLEFVFNPNVDFIPSKNPSTGNDVYGIWAASTVSRGFRVGSMDENIDEPHNSDGYEYGIKIQGSLPDETLFTLNFFDGVQNDPVKRSRYGEGLANYAIKMAGFSDDEGQPVINPLMEGFYPDQRYVGFTFGRDFPDLYSAWLGGVGPLIRGEFLYQFDATFTTVGLGSPGTSLRERYEEHDLVYWGLGVEWKFKWNLLNPRRYFSLMPQFAHKHIFDYPDVDSATGKPYHLAGPLGSDVAENLYQIFVNLSTQYMNDTVSPSIVYLRDIMSDVAKKTTSGSLKSDLWLFRLAYAPNERWSFKAQLTLMGNHGYAATDHYDNISFTVQRQF